MWRGPCWRILNCRIQNQIYYNHTSINIEKHPGENTSVNSGQFGGGIKADIFFLPIF